MAGVTDFLVCPALLNRLQQSPAALRDFRYSPIEGLLIRAGRFIEPADLAHELQCRSI
jgi:hypothetical protein